MREAQALKAQVDVAQQKETGLKEHIQPWLDEALVVSSNIEGKLAHMQAASEPGQAMELDTDTLVARVEWVKQKVDDFVARVNEA